MMKNFKKTLLVTLIFALFGAIWVPVAYSAGKDTLVVALSDEPNNLDPHNVGLISAGQVQEEIFNKLLYRDTKGDLHPELATSWEQTDDKTIVFHLRDDVFFHNGEKLTAEDVRYTIQRATELPQSASLFKSFDGKNTRVIDDLTVEVKLKAPFAAALNYLATTRGFIVSKKAVEELGIDEFGRHPVGSGPFRFIRWEKGDRFILEAYDKYWGSRPGYKHFIARIIPDPSVQAIELESGGVDLLLSVSPIDYQRLHDNPKIITYAAPGYTHEMLQFNMRSEKFADKRIRQALTYALDIPAIVRAVYGDLGVPADSIFSSEIFAHISIGPVKRDVSKAKTLLVEAGFPDGFSAEITVPDGKTTLSMLEIAQAMWKEAGIEVTITPYDQATMKDRNAAGLTQFGRSNFTATTGDPDHAMANWAIGYLGVFNANDEYIDGKMAEGRAEYDPEKRAAIYAELQKYCWDGEKG
jgi:peptide/nickel transport system substrate-binding protein